MISAYAREHLQMAVAKALREFRGSGNTDPSVFLVDAVLRELDALGKVVVDDDWLQSLLKDVGRSDQEETGGPQPPELGWRMPGIR